MPSNELEKTIEQLNSSGNKMSFLTAATEEQIKQFESAHNINANHGLKTREDKRLNIW